MKLAEMKDSFKDFWSEFKREKTGVVGLILFAIFLFIVIFEPVLLPFADANDRWRDITYWEDWPKSAPPAWTNWFTTEKKATTEVLEEFDENAQDLGGMVMKEFVFDYDYQFDDAPNDIIIHGDASGQPIVVVNIIRPDGEDIEAFQSTYNAGERTKDIRISIDNLSLIHI